MAIAFLQPRDYVQHVAPDCPPATPRDASAYTRWLATRHYENFHIASALLPRALHQDFYNVYAFCRWADDLGDEIGDRQRSLQLLRWWRAQLEAMYRGEVTHPVFVALAGTVRSHDIPIEPFARLIDAFEQDQKVTRYRNWDELFAYCERSANPVGHIVLYLCGYRDLERQRLADRTCTGLQLANFWQDIAVDLGKHRVYLPLDLLEKNGYTIADLYERRYNTAFRQAMREAVAVAETCFQDGLPLMQWVDRRLRFDLALFTRGGLKILAKIKREEYNVLERRPVVSKAERLGILFSCLPRLLR